MRNNLFITESSTKVKQNKENGLNYSIKHAGDICIMLCIRFFGRDLNTKRTNRQRAEHFSHTMAVRDIGRKLQSVYTLQRLSLIDTVKCERSLYYTAPYWTVAWRGVGTPICTV